MDRRHHERPTKNHPDINRVHRERRYRRVASGWSNRELLRQLHPATAAGVREGARVVTAARAARQGTKTRNRVGRRDKRNLHSQDHEEDGSERQAPHLVTTLHPDTERGNRDEAHEPPPFGAQLRPVLGANATRKAARSRALGSRPFGIPIAIPVRRPL